MPKPSILLVEDNPDEVQLMSEALASIDAGIDVQVAVNVSAAMALVDGMTYDHLPWLVITDHHLPDGCGQELIARLQTSQAGKRVAVVMVSGDSQRPADLGDIAWFTKPDTWSGWRGLAQELIARVIPR